MSEFSERSQKELSTCHEDLIELFSEVVKYFDCTVLTGHRNEADQRKAVALGNSKAPWPTSKHNSKPSRAVDAAPYPIDWDDRERFILFAGFVLGTATHLGVQLRWGGDFNGNRRTKDERLSDLVHFELAEIQ